MEHLHSILVNTAGFFSDMTIVVSVLVLVAVAFFILVPVLYYHLNVHDGLRSYNNHRYQIFVFAHKRFRKVLEGKMSYERFRDDVKKIYDKDNFDRVRNNETRNNKARNDFEFLAEAVDDEELIRRYFSGPALSFDKFEELEQVLSLRPARKCTSDSTPENPIHLPSHERKGKLTAVERNAPGSFLNLIHKKNKSSEIINWCQATLATIRDGAEYTAFIDALKNSGGICYSSSRELFDCVNSSFNPGFIIQYSALMSQQKQYRDGYAPEDVAERIDNLIDKYSNELKEIMK